MKLLGFTLIVIGILIITVFATLIAESYRENEETYFDFFELVLHRRHTLLTKLLSNLILVIMAVAAFLSILSGLMLL